LTRFLTCELKEEEEENKEGKEKKKEMLLHEQRETEREREREREREEFLRWKGFSKGRFSEIRDFPLFLFNRTGLFCLP